MVMLSTFLLLASSSERDCEAGYFPDRPSSAAHRCLHKGPIANPMIRLIVTRAIATCIFMTRSNRPLKDCTSNNIVNSVAPSVVVQSSSVMRGVLKHAACARLATTSPRGKCSPIDQREPSFKTRGHELQFDIRNSQRSRISPPRTNCPLDCFDHAVCFRLR